MENRIEIVEASYGIGQENDIDIRHLFSKEKRLHKSIDLHHVLENDPYPNKKKFVKVVFKNDEDRRSILIHEECLKIKEGGKRLGFDGQSFEIHIPNMYHYQVLEASFAIHKIEVFTLGSSHLCKTIVQDRWRYVVSRSESGFHHVQNFVKADQLSIEGDPFPGEKKVFRIEYSQMAKYQVIVYEVAGKLVKDIVLVELPKYQCTMLYHFYPKFDHPVMTIHKKYLRICKNVFQKMIVSIAHDRMGSTTNENGFLNMIHALGGSENIIFLHTINNKHRGEAMSFMNLLNSVSYLHDDHIIFYAHSKGLGHYNRNYVESITKWVELMYIQCLMNVDTMIYTRANCGGSFRKHCMINNHHNPKWHYSGSFFLFKSTLLNRKQIIQRYGYDYFISERCPGLLCPNGENCLVFLELHRGFEDLYEKKSSNYYHMYLPC